MRLEWLEDILAVAETGSFAEAAERRRLTQSAFSRRIRSIEAYVGVELFDRTRKPVQLRPATEEQRERMTRLAQTLRQLVDDLERGDRLEGNWIVLASQHALTASVTPRLLGALQTREPDLFVRLRSANLDECIGMLFARQADMALVYSVQGQDHDLGAQHVETKVIGSDRFLPVHSPGGAAKVGRQGALPLVVYPSDVFFGQVMEQVILPKLRDAWRIAPRVETALTFAALELARVGVGAAWVPASLAGQSLRERQLLDLSQYLPSCNLSVLAVRLAGRGSDAAQRVWEELQDDESG